MTRPHLLSKIRDCVHGIKVLKSKTPTTMQNILAIHDLENEKESLWKRVRKMRDKKAPCNGC